MASWHHNGTNLRSRIGAETAPLALLATAEDAQFGTSGQTIHQPLVRRDGVLGTHLNPGVLGLVRQEDGDKAGLPL